MPVTQIEQKDIKFGKDGRARFALGNTGVVMVVYLENQVELEDTVDHQPTPTPEPQPTVAPAKQTAPPTPAPSAQPSQQVKQPAANEGHPVPISKRDWLGHCQYQRKDGKWRTAIIIDTRNNNGRELWLAWLANRATLKTAKVAYKAYGRGGPYWVKMKADFIKNIVWY